MERKDQIYNFVHTYLEGCFDDGDYMNVWNEELDGDHVGMLDEDFDEYVADNEAGFLSVYKSLSSKFDPNDTYFCNTHSGYDSSRDLFDFITLDDVMEWATDFLDSYSPEALKEEINPSDFKYYGLGKLVKLFKEHFPPEPKHTEEDIKIKIDEYISELDDGQLLAILSLEGFDKVMMMSNFPAYVKNKNMHDVIAAMVQALPCDCFTFFDPFFEDLGENGNLDLVSLPKFDVVAMAFNNIDKINDTLLECSFPSLAEIKKGNW